MRWEQFISYWRGKKSRVSSVVPGLTSILITLLHVELKAFSVQFNDQTRRH